MLELNINPDPSKTCIRVSTETCTSVKTGFKDNKQAQDVYAKLLTFPSTLEAQIYLTQLIIYSVCNE